MNLTSIAVLLVLVCAIGACHACLCSSSCSCVPPKERTPVVRTESSDCSGPTAGPTDIPDIPDDFRAKLKGNWFFAAYPADEKNVVKTPENECRTVTIDVNDGDVLNMDFLNSHPQTGEAAWTYKHVGTRVDDGQTTKYKWAEQKNDTNSNETFTLLSATDAYLVFLQQNIFKGDVPIEEWIEVFSKSKTLTADQLEAIERVQKKNGFAVKLSPAQNFNCKQCTA